MPDYQLTEGLIQRLNDPDFTEDISDTKPIVQILTVKKVASPSGPVDRYRIIVSDGELYLQAMLATQLNSLIEEGSITKNTICQLDKFTCNTVSGKKLLIVLGVTVVGQSSVKIGAPQGAQQSSVVGDATTPAVAPQAATESTTNQPSLSTIGQGFGGTSGSSTTPTTPGKTRPPAGRPGGRGPAVFPIEGLSPYQNNWTIKARVTQKSDVRTWSNQRGEGKLFNVTFMDETGEIRGTAFNTVVDALYDKLEEGKVYYVSKAKVNLAKKQFSNIANEYELGLERNTEIEECRETINLPLVRYNFIDLSKLQDQVKDSICDVIAVVKETGEVTEFMSKFGKPTQKRELTLVDRSGFSVRITLWGKNAEKFAHTDQPVIAVKGVKVGDFGGRSLSMFSSSILEVNPDIPECHALRGWFDAGGNGESFQSHTSTFSGGGNTPFNRSELITLEEVKTKELGSSDKVDYFSTRATVMHIKTDTIMYPACPSQGCNKKVFDQHDGWKCEKCDRSFTQPEYRYIISMAVADHTGQAWFQGFNDLGEALFHRPAQELVTLRENDESGYNKIIEDAIGQQFNFTCRAKQDSYNETTRTRYGVMRIVPLDYAEESRHLMKLLSSTWAQ